MGKTEGGGGGEGFQNKFINPCGLIKLVLPLVFKINIKSEVLSCNCIFYQSTQTSEGLTRTCGFVNNLEIQNSLKKRERTLELQFKSF